MYDYTFSTSVIIYHTPSTTDNTITLVGSFDRRSGRVFADDDNDVLALGSRFTKYEYSRPVHTNTSIHMSQLCIQK